MEKDFNEEENKLRNLLNEDENPLNVPSGYFEELPEKIMMQINELPDFEKSSVLNPFNTPAGYFENLPNAINEKIISDKSDFYVWLTNLQRPRIALPLAFATIILLTGLFFYKQNKYNHMPAQEFTVEELQNSIFLESVDEELLVEFVGNTYESENDESMEQYLIENYIEIQLIEKEL